MANVELFIALLAGVVCLVSLAGPLRIPYPVLLVVGGLGAGLLPFVPGVRVDPDIVLLVFLPPILYAAAFEFASEDVREEWQPIALLAVGLVVLTIAAAAWVAHLVAGLPWGAAFILGAVLGPTDPVAAVSVLRRLGGSQRTGTILVGESLVNDATGLTAFKIAVAAVGSQTLSPGSAALDVLVIVAGGAAIGLAFGWLSIRLRRRLDLTELEIAVSLIAAYGAFAAAERVGVSGILATVVSGYLAGRADDLTGPHTRLQANGFWSALAFVAESVLFVLVGLAFADVLERANMSLGRVALYSLALAATLFAVRCAWMFTVPYLARGGPLTRPRERLMISASGMRGAVSVAAALAVPVSVAERDTILLLTSGTVLLTLVPAGLALPWLVRALGLTQDDDDRRRYVDARVSVAHAALRRAEELTDEAPEELLARAREAYELRIARLEQSVPGEGSDDGGRADAYRSLRRKLLEAEQEALEDLSGDDVNGEARRAVQRQLDLEASRLGSD